MYHARSNLPYGGPDGPVLRLAFRAFNVWQFQRLAFDDSRVLRLMFSGMIDGWCLMIHC